MSNWFSGLPSRTSFFPLFDRSKFVQGYQSRTVKDRLTRMRTRLPFRSTSVMESLLDSDILYTVSRVRSGDNGRVGSSEKARNGSSTWNQRGWGVYKGSENGENRIKGRQSDAGCYDICGARRKTAAASTTAPGGQQQQSQMGSLHSGGGVHFPLGGAPRQLITSQLRRFVSSALFFSPQSGKKIRRSWEYNI